MELELAHAHRDALELIHHGASPNLPESLVDLAWDAQTTLALALALHGWPLLRSGHRFEQARYSDLVHPEALAQRIVTWEAWAAYRGWHIATPRIPGLEYRTWSEIEG